jgi:hypothetical protein
MPQPGQQMMSLRSQQGWRGFTTNTQADLGDRRFSAMENMYISADGSELRMAPGWKTVYYFNGGRAARQGASYQVTGTGFWKDVNDLNYPVSAAVTNNYQQYETGFTKQMKVYAEPTHLHAFKFVRGRFCLIGESAARKEPIYDAGSTTYVTVTAWSSATECVLTTSANYLTDTGGLTNAIDVESIILLSGTGLPSVLQNKAHRVVARPAANQITIATDTTGNGGSGTASIDLIRWGNAFAAGAYPISIDSDDATDDPQALTVWWSLDKPDVNNLHRDALHGIGGASTCFPSYVANRMRDSGDSAARMTEGVSIFPGRGAGAIAQGAGGVAALVFTSTAGVPIVQQDITNFWSGWIAIIDGAFGRRYGVIATNTIGAGFTVTVTAWLGGAAPAGACTLSFAAVPFTRRRPKSLPFRVNPDLAGSRVLIGAPGYGCVFQAPVVLPNDPNILSANVGLQYRANDLLDRPRSLGVPKGEMFVDRDATATSSHFYVTTGGAGLRPDARYQFTNGSAFTFWVSYRDDATGEIGLLSEPVTLTIPAALRGVRLFVKHPGYVMAETAALTVMVWRSAAGATQPYLVGTLPLNGHVYPQTAPPFGERLLSIVSVKYGIEPPTTMSGSYSARHMLFQIDVPFQSDAELQANDVPTGIEQMPAGAGCVRTVRGFTFFGNRIGNAGSELELFTAPATSRYDGLPAVASGPYTNASYMTVRDSQVDQKSTSLKDGPWLCGSASIPSGYAGIGARLGGVQFWPFPSFAMKLDFVTNNKTDNSSSLTWKDTQNWQKWIVQDSTIVPGTGADSVNYAWGNGVGASNKEGVTGYLELPRGTFQWSLVGNPWATPATQIGYVDAEGAEEVQGIGALGGGVIFSTNSNTYYQTFVTEPRSLPDTATDEFGCIAANSMVEFDGGTCWLSERGPVAMMGGGVTYIGRDLEKWFVGRSARYKRDSRGLMRHSWACHDNDRGLVYFGMFADRNGTVTVTDKGTVYTWATASDQIRSRFPCDEILVWNYRQNAFSVWVPPQGLEYLWMERTVDADGANRILFLAADKNVYAYDDLYNDTNKDPISGTVTVVAGTTAVPVLTITATLSSDIIARDAGENFVRNGMNVIVTRGSQATCVGTGVVASFTANTVTVTMDEAVQLRTGDLVTIGVKRAAITTNFFSPTMTEMGRELASVHARYSLSSLFTIGAGGTPQPAAISITARPTRRPDSVDSLGQLGTSSLTRMESYGINYRSLGSSIIDEWAPITRLTSGKVASDAIKLEVRLIGGAQVRIADLLVEV